MIVSSARVSHRSSEESASLEFDVCFFQELRILFLVTGSLFLQYFTSFYFLYVVYQLSQPTCHIYESTANRFNIRECGFKDWKSFSEQIYFLSLPMSSNANAVSPAGSSVKIQILLQM